MEQHHAHAPRSHRSRTDRAAAVDARRVSRGGRLAAMTRLDRWVIMGIAAMLLAGACTCSGGRSPKVTPGSNGPVSGNANDCDGIRAKVEQLYRAEAQAKEPKRVDEAVADNAT